MSFWRESALRKEIIASTSENTLNKRLGSRLPDTRLLGWSQNVIRRTNPEPAPGGHNVQRLHPEAVGRCTAWRFAARGRDGAARSNGADHERSQGRKAQPVPGAGRGWGSAGGTLHCSRALNRNPEIMGLDRKRPSADRESS